MKKLLVVLLVLTLVLVVAAVAKEGTGKAVNGWVTDAKCGVKGTSAAPAACAKKCIAAGEKMAFVPDGTQDVLIVDNPDSLKGHEGHHVTVTGNTDMAKKTIHVDSVKMMAEGGEMKH
ncbi:MAG TPA: hypothetical protein VES66_01020 [Terriglobales bacterium]|nr:hypothetical protein [Terriglobales bacterium]